MSSIIPAFFLLSTAAKIQKRNFSNISLGETFVFLGTFPDGNSALMLVCARLRHVTGTQWDGKKYMCMKHLEIQEDLAG